MPLVSLAQGYLDRRLIRVIWTVGSQKKGLLLPPIPTQAQLWTVPTTTLSSGGCDEELSPEEMAPSALSDDSGTSSRKFISPKGTDTIMGKMRQARSTRFRRFRRWLQKPQPSYVPVPVSSQNWNLKEAFPTARALCGEKETCQV